MIMVVAFALTALASSGCGNDSATVSPEGSTEAQSIQLSEEYVRQLAENQHNNPMVVREATVTGEHESREVIIGIDRPSWLQDGSVIGVMGSYAQNVFTTLFDYPEVASVTITMYGVEQGVPGDDVAMRLMLDREKLPEVDWSMFGPMMLSDMVTEYYVAPQIEENTYL